ncbi:MAG: DUF1761 domain-containing protein [Ardenticatenales bacterium]|jgi:hypothetical protein|nr:DUF1761 domain-containing protein [Ardenticatenales bacterium]
MRFIMPPVSGAAGIRATSATAPTHEEDGMELLEHVNWIAIVVCVVAAMALGFVWYGPLFGKLWLELMGWGNKNEAELKEMQSKAMPGYAVMAVGAAIMALVLHAVLHATAATTVAAAATVAAVLWLGFVATSTLGTAMFSDTDKRLWALTEGYVLVQMVVFAVILTLMAA